LLVQAFDLRLNVVRRHFQIVEGAGSVDASRDELRVAGEQAQDVDVFKEADVVAVGLDGETAPAVARHQEQRLEDEVVGSDRRDVEMRNLADWRVEREALKHHRLRQVHARDHADALAIPNEEGVDVGVAHAVSGVLDRPRPVDENGRAMASIPHAGS
jgi:hypothetical protein